MSKKQIYKIKLNDEEFKKVKKNKQSIILRLNDDENQKIKVKDKIVLINSKNKKLKKKVKLVNKYSSVREVFDNNQKKKLGYKRKEEISFEDIEKAFSKNDLKKYGLLAIGVKSKKHIFRKVLLGILILLVLLFSYRFVGNKFDEINAKRFNKAINEIAKDKTDYVFVEINPSFLLTIKDNKVSDIACLNDDCISFYKEIDIKGKSIIESIDNLYNLAKSKGFDTSNGIKIKTTIEIDVKDKDYITVELINEADKNKLLNNVKNNEKVKNNSNDNYYTELWNRLKKDSDYDKVYTCNINNDELECYFIMESITTDPKTTSLVSYEKKSNNIANTFDKFNIRHNYDFNNVLINGEIWNVYIGNQKFDLSDSIGYSLILDEGEVGKTEKMVLIVSGDESDYQHFLSLKYLNLVNPTSSLNKITSLESYAKSIEQQYNLDEPNNVR